MKRAEGKAARINQIERLLWSHPEGLSRTEVARRIGVHRSVITKYLDQDALPPSIYEDYLDGKRLKIDRAADLTRASFTLHEVMAIHLATRLLATRTDKQNPHAASALRKLGTALQRLDRNVSRHLLRSADVMDEDASYRDPVYLDVLETLTAAWASGRKVRVSHQMEDGRIFDYTFCPYFIEPYAVGQTAHVLGLREPPGKVRTFKIERLRSAEILREEYELPDTFDPGELLRHAWGIWYTEAEPQEVVLRFHPRVVRRVQESRWQRGEKTELQADGYLLWRAAVAEPKEMMPWVRGWGADCEVLEPLSLRQELVEECARLAGLYQISDTQGTRTMDIFEQYFSLPGKTDPELTIFEHSSDVYHVACYLLKANSEGVRNPELIKAGALFHDVGKIEQDRDTQRNQWIHQPHSSKYLQPLLSHPRMQRILADNDIDVDQIDDDDLLLICENHHNIPTKPALLRRCPEALLVSIADVIASSVEAGWVGDIRQMLTTNTYIDLNVSLLENLQLDRGLDSEIHRVDLPGDSVADALLNDLIFRDMEQQLGEYGLEPILQKQGSLWVVGCLETLKSFLQEYVVNPRTLYESANLQEELYEGVLAAMPAPGAVSPDTIRYLLANEAIARKVMQGLVDRRKVRQALEHFGISVGSFHEALGTRGRSVADKLEALGDRLPYLIVGDQASYQYHHWRTPPSGLYELMIEKEEFDTWYGYLCDSQIAVDKSFPTSKDFQRFSEVVVLIPELTKDLWKNRNCVNEVAYIAPDDLLFRLIQAQSEASVSEALAILVTRQENWDWVELASGIKNMRLVRQFGCLFEILNQEANQEVVPEKIYHLLFDLVQDTVGEAVFTFPLNARREGIASSTPQNYRTIGRRWGLDVELPRHIVTKVLDDLRVLDDDK